MEAAMAKKLLVIDDERDVREGLQEWLEDCGYYVATAANGDEGLRNAGKNRPHLILLDIAMPERDGFEVLQRLKENAATALIPVIMLTAKAESSFIFRAQQLQATDYVTKPFDEDQLLALIRKYDSDSYSYRHSAF
jgi:two-component system, OmpR family, alkaline phosphatase synthesis response regulator PhoP